MDLEKETSRGLESYILNTGSRSSNSLGIDQRPSRGLGLQENRISRGLSSLDPLRNISVNVDVSNKGIQLGPRRLNQTVGNLGIHSCDCSHPSDFPYETRIGADERAKLIDDGTRKEDFTTTIRRRSSLGYFKINALVNSKVAKYPQVRIFKSVDRAVHVVSSDALKRHPKCKFGKGGQDCERLKKINDAPLQAAIKGDVTSKERSRFKDYLGTYASFNKDLCT